MDNQSCELSNKKCVPCQGGIEPLKGAALEPFKAQIHPEWDIIDQHHLEKTFKFKNFKQALAFVNAVGELAESEGHHPEITFTWGRATIRIWTHKINGLHPNDFILASKIDKIQPAH